MIVVRMEWQCKWGRVGEVLASAKERYEHVRGQLGAIKGIRILTDMSGSQDTVVFEMEVESLDAYFAMMDAFFASPGFQAEQAEQMASGHPYESAVRNFYKVEAILK